MVLYSRDRLITNQSVFPEALLRYRAEHGSVGDSREEPRPPPLPRRLLSSWGEKWVCQEKLEGMEDQGRNGGRQCVWTWETEEGYETAPNSNRRTRSSTCLHRGHWAGFEASSLLWVLLAVHSSCEPDYGHSCTAYTPPVPSSSPARQCTSCPLFPEGLIRMDNNE